MVIKYRMFPYPVLADFLDDYRDSRFDTTIDISKDGFNIRVDFNTILRNPELQTLVDTGKAKFVYHLECSQTGFRKVIQTSEKICFDTLSYHEVRGKLEICALIVAIQDIDEYTNALFHEDYAGTTFSIEAGCILAVGRQIYMIIEKDRDDLSNIPSIFSIIPKVDNTVKHMIVDTQDASGKIVIQIPMRDFTVYDLLNESTKIQPVLNSIVIIPALIVALEQVKATPCDSRYELESFGWYITIRKVLAERFSCNIESEDFENWDIVELAQKLINEPLHDALIELTKIGRDDRGSDSE